MNKINKCLVKCIIDTLVFIEFSDEEILNPDVGLELMEQISAELSNLTNEDKEEFEEISIGLLSQYPDICHNFIKSLKYNILSID